MATGGVVWTDRYGGNWPDPALVCPGPCEGLGVYPLRVPGTSEWTFPTCPDCGGTGRRPVSGVAPYCSL